MSNAAMNLPKQLALVFMLGTLVACSSTRMSPAPVVDRTSSRASSVEPAPPGFYRVKRGDTLLRIALDHGQSYRDIAEWNNLNDPNLIEVDQLIRVVPPKSSARLEIRKDKPEPRKEPVKPIADANKDLARAKPELKSEPKPEAKAPTVADTAPKADTLASSSLRLTWPSKGEVVERFDEGKNKGIGIAGKEGDPILAAADGKVVYAGNSLRGYGNLVIVKHDNTYLTAYAHNKTLLVKEGEMVKRSQRIAEMGATDANRTKLHFELRKNGKPVDPTAYLQ